MIFYQGGINISALGGMSRAVHQALCAPGTFVVLVIFIVVYHLLQMGLVGVNLIHIPCTRCHLLLHVSQWRLCGDMEYLPFLAADDLGRLRFTVCLSPTASTQHKPPLTQHLDTSLVHQALCTLAVLVIFIVVYHLQRRDLRCSRLQYMGAL